MLYDIHCQTSSTGAIEDYASVQQIGDCAALDISGATTVQAYVCTVMDVRECLGIVAMLMRLGMYHC